MIVELTYSQRTDIGVIEKILCNFIAIIGIPLTEKYCLVFILEDYRGKFFATLVWVETLSCPIGL